MRPLALVLAFLAGFSFPVSGKSPEEIPILISKDIAMYREAAATLQQLFGSQKSKTYFLSGDSSSVGLLREIRSRSPEVVVAVGAKAAVEAVGSLSRTPVVYLMVVNPEKQGLVGRSQVHGVSWMPAPASMAQSLRTVLPAARRVGMLLGSPDEHASSFKRELTSFGLEPVISSIKDAADIPQALRNLHNIDLLWMGTDPLLASQASFEILKAYCAGNRIPLVAPMKASAGGVLIGLTTPPSAAAGQAHLLVERILAGERIRDGLFFAPELSLSVDMDVARSLGLAIPPNALKSAEVINP